MNEDKIVETARLLYRRFAGRKDAYCALGYRGFDLEVDQFGCSFP